MCGGGGGGYSGSRSGGRRSNFQDLERKAQLERDRGRYEANINNYLKEKLRDYNSRDAEQIRIHLQTIRDALSQEIEIINLLYGGSISRWTYLNGLSDVDVLAILDDSVYREKTPQEVLDIFCARLKERLPRTDIKVGNLAVTVTFSDGHEIQVLPAIKTSTGIRIADPENNEWSSVIKPHKFAEKLTEVNQRNNGMVVRIIKLYKGINAKLPKEDRLSGYHIESLAIKAFENYDGNMSYKEMLKHFVDKARTLVESPIEDSTGQSLQVDDYLGGFWSGDRRRRRDVINKIYTEIEQAEFQKSVSKWKEIIEE